MLRVPRVPGRRIKLNPLPGVTARLNAPAAAFGGPDLSPALEAIEALFEETSNPGAPIDPDLPEIDPQTRAEVEQLQANMAAAGDMYNQAGDAYREATSGPGGLFNLDADKLFSGGTRPDALLKWPTEDFEEIGQDHAGKLADPAQRALFEYLWDHDRAVEMPRAEAFIRAKQKEFRKGALTRFWQGADQVRDQLTEMLQVDWRNYKAVGGVYAEKLKIGLSVGASSEDLRARALDGVLAFNRAALESVIRLYGTI